MNDIFIRLQDGLPLSVRAYTIVDANGDYNIYINSKLTMEQMRKSLAHEQRHIDNGDFDKMLPAHIIERCS